MATPTMQVPETEVPKPKRIPDLSGSYRKAHKNYVLVAGLLASWELIGIDPEKLGEKWGVVLKSPRGVPLILFTLLAYCGYKAMVEWAQCNPDRRKITAAKVDYRIAHLIAIGAVAIGLIQYLARIRVADVISGRTPSFAVSLAMSIAFMPYFSVRCWTYWKERHTFVTWDGFTVLMNCLAVLAMGSYGGVGLRKSYLGWTLGVAGGVLGASVILAAQRGLFSKLGKNKAG